jgi:hypothetical protein
MFSFGAVRGTSRSSTFRRPSEVRLAAMAAVIRDAPKISAAASACGAPTARARLVRRVAHAHGSDGWRQLLGLGGRGRARDTGRTLERGGSVHRRSASRGAGLVRRGRAGRFDDRGDLEVRAPDPLSRGSSIRPLRADSPCSPTSSASAASSPTTTATAASSSTACA